MITNMIFGSLKPDHQFTSVLLHSKYHEKLSEWLYPVTKGPYRWATRYRARWNGWSSSTFHSRCDKKGETITVVKVGNYIFGGYTDAEWRK